MYQVCNIIRFFFCGCVCVPSYFFHSQHSQKEHLALVFFREWNPDTNQTIRIQPDNWSYPDSYPDTIRIDNRIVVGRKEKKSPEKKKKKSNENPQELKKKKKKKKKKKIPKNFLKIFQQKFEFFFSLIFFCFNFFPNIAKIFKNNEKLPR